MHQNHSSYDDERHRCFFSPCCHPHARLLKCRGARFSTWLKRRSYGLVFSQIWCWMLIFFFSSVENFLWEEFSVGVMGGVSIWKSSEEKLLGRKSSQKLAASKLVFTQWSQNKNVKWHACTWKRIDKIFDCIDINLKIRWKLLIFRIEV